VKKTFFPLETRFFPDSIQGAGETAVFASRSLLF
jgi:hypothetical protein